LLNHNDQNKQQMGKPEQWEKTRKRITVEGSTGKKRSGRGMPVRGTEARSVTEHPKVRI